MSFQVTWGVIQCLLSKEQVRSREARWPPWPNFGLVLAQALRKLVWPMHLWMHRRIHGECFAQSLKSAYAAITQQSVANWLWRIYIYTKARWRRVEITCLALRLGNKCIRICTLITYILIYVNTYMHTVCIHIHMHIHICTYIHTHTHILYVFTYAHHVLRTMCYITFRKDTQGMGLLFGIPHNTCHVCMWLITVSTLVCGGGT